MNVTVRVENTPSAEPVAAITTASVKLPPIERGATRTVMNSNVLPIKRTGPPLPTYLFKASCA